MNAPQDTLQSEAPVPESQDNFASGDQNKLNLLALRLAAWLFHPPYFPTELIWVLLALIATNCAVGLLTLPDTYWINPGTSSYYTFLGTPFNWGLWTIGIFIGYMLLIGLVLMFLSAKPALGLWMAMSVYHFWVFANWFRCGTILYFPFENSSNCSGYYSSVLVVTGVMWGLAVLVMSRRGLVPWIASQDTTTNDLPSKRTRGLPVVSMVWIGLMSVAVIFGAIVPKPVWQLVETKNAPPGRSSASLVYDTHRSVAVLFGGTNAWAQTTGWHTINDTWEWNGNDWIEMNPTHSPSPRFGAGMAFDEKRGITVLFGGSGQDANYQTTFNGDTWEWNGQDWTDVSPTPSPLPRQSTNMFFDPLRGTVVIYGGYYFDSNNQTNVFLDDAWEWDGENWKQIPFDEPRRISASAIVYDRARQLPMLMDAEGLWFWEGPRWVQPNYNTSPPGRWGSQMIYDPSRQQVILFGGYEGDNKYNDTWEYDGQAWQQVITTTQPPTRNGHNMFYDQSRDRVLLFGGLDGLTFYDDMWELVQP